MNWKVGEAKGVLQMSNQSAISKTRRLLKGQKNRMSNARTLGVFLYQGVSGLVLHDHSGRFGVLTATLVYVSTM